MKIILETTTGQLVPAGVAAQLPRGGTQPIELQFLTGGVAGELAGDPAIALAAYTPADLENSVWDVDQWEYDPDRQLYVGEINTLAAPLAWLGRTPYIAKITWGAEETEPFHLVYGEAGGGAPGEPPRVVVPPAQPAEFPVALVCEGELTAAQLYGYFKATRAGQVLRAQVAAQVAPTGQAAILRLRQNAGDVADRDTNLPAGDKTVEKVFDVPLDYAAGDVIRFKPTQVGSVLPGAGVVVNLICRHVE